MLGLGAPITIVGGLGRSIKDLSPTEVTTFLKILMCSMLTYSLTITSVKISLLVLYRRIFDTAAFKKKSLFVGSACVIWWVVEVFTNIFQCRPFAAAFDPASLFTDRCINLQAYYIGITVSNLALDIVMLFLPLQMVWNLKLPPKQKFALSAIFSLGLVPLFTNINTTFTKRLSGLLTRSKPGFSKDSGGDSDDPERNLQYEWPAARGLQNPITYQDMHAKVAKNGLHVLNVKGDSLGSSTTCTATPPDKSWSQKSEKKKYTSYKSPPLIVTRENEVIVDAWA
ncbi:MAG: hypothetical protein Q9166_004837 [cf. Caloplaca sp. 2 TL-2023]